MKKLLALALLVVVVLVALAVATKGEPAEPVASKEITSFTFSHRGSSSQANYHISLVRQGDKAQVEVNSPALPNSPITFEADARVFETLQKVVEKAKVDSWDGFKGSNPSVSDGSGFSLAIGYSDGSSVEASGDNKFPSNYGEAAKEITEVLSQQVLGLSGWGDFKLPF